VQNTLLTESVQSVQCEVMREWTECTMKGNDRD